MNALGAFLHSLLSNADLEAVINDLEDDAKVELLKVVHNVILKKSAAEGPGQIPPGQGPGGPA